MSFRTGSPRLSTVSLGNGRRDTGGRTALRAPPTPVRRRPDMATVLFVVKATISKDQEAAFNRWYNEEHCPQLLQYKGAVSARRYRAILGEDKYQYMALYEFQDEPTFRRFLESTQLKDLKTEYDAKFGASERARAAYVQVWP
ncbi:MAG: hypothetical protein DME17_01280 [Candidatus Rokuibacteriota bacterium]|nr:MAG: hypothetical protein DME17_01280 [Candidatus Rokubacteria bacterium]